MTFHRRCKCGRLIDRRKRVCLTCQTKKSQETHKHKLDVLRRWVIEGYGGKCGKCGTWDQDVLTIDHVRNDGKQERKNLKGSEKLYRKIILKKFPKEYQILCRNCNWKKYLHYKAFGNSIPF